MKTVAFRCCAGFAACFQILALPAGHAGVPLMLRDVVPGSGSSMSFEAAYIPPGPVSTGGVVFFIADQPGHGAELWKSDGTLNGTTMVKDILPGPGSSSPQLLTASGGRVFFTATTPEAGTELWVSDGTRPGTGMVRDILPGPGSSQPRVLTSVDGLLYFSANDGVSGNEPWRSDGTEAGTWLLKDVWPGTSFSYPNSSAPEGFTRAGNQVYFTASLYNAPGIGTLWRTDGTAAGTVRADTGTEGAGDLAAAPDGSLYFTARDYSTHDDHALFRHAANVTEKIKAFYSGYEISGAGPIYSAHAQRLTFAGNTLFFTCEGMAPTANYGDTVRFNAGLELWKSDGTSGGTRLAADLQPGPEHSYPSEFTVIRDSPVLFFTAIPSGNIRLSALLYKSEGNAATTVPLVPPSSAPASLAAAGTALYFSARDAAEGTEIWRSGGTPATTARAGIAVGGTASVYPSRLTAGGGFLFFQSGKYAYTGAEPWMIPIPHPEAGPLTVAANTLSSITLSASVNPGGLATVARIEYGPTLSYGSTHVLNLSPSAGTVPQTFVYTINGLTPGTTLHARIRAESEGTSVTPDLVIRTATASQMAWRTTHFSDATGGGRAGDDADPDNDGVTNVLEFLAGTLPLSAASRLVVEVAPDQSTVTIAPVRPGIRYVVRSSPDLDSWTDWAAQTYAATAASAVIPNAQPPASRRFFQLRMDEIP